MLLARKANTINAVSFHLVTIINVSDQYTTTTLLNFGSRVLSVYKSLISVVAQFGSICLEANLGNRLYIYRHSIIDMCVKVFVCVCAYVR